MSEDNPYQAPKSDVKPESLSTEAVLGGPYSLPAGRGIGWISEGFDLFKRAPGAWVINMFIFFIVVIVLGIIPFVSLILNLLMPVFTAGFMLGCKDLENGNELQVAHIFAGFKQRTSSLVGVGAIYLLMLVILMGITFGLLFALGGGSAFMSGDPNAINPQMSMQFVLAILIATAVSIPIVMAYWFAPALIVFHQELGVIEAFKLSFIGCIKNIVPFLLFGIVAFVLAIVASIPVMLGWFILGPTMIGSTYAAYKEIFLEGMQ